MTFYRLVKTELPLAFDPFIGWRISFIRFIDASKMLLLYKLCKLLQVQSKTVDFTYLSFHVIKHEKLIVHSKNIYICYSVY